MTHDEMVAVIQAHKRGETIEAREIRSGEGEEGWFELWHRPVWNFDKIEYRIKPREPREWWILPKGSCGTGKVQMIGEEKFSSPHGEVVHVREILP